MRGANDFATERLSGPLLPFTVSADEHTTTAAWWSDCIDGGCVVPVRSVEVARQVVLAALALAPRDTVLVPANATHALIETVRRSAAGMCFGALDDALELTADHAVAVAWAEPVLGLPTASSAPACITVIDHGDSLPHGVGPRAWLPPGADVAIYGLHLAAEAEQAGALLVFGNRMLATTAALLLDRADRLDDSVAAARLMYIGRWSPRHLAALAAVHAGLRSAAGLPLLAPAAAGALARGVAVQIPAECDAATFVAYLQGENTSYAWLPALRPLHYAAADHHATAARVARWLLAPAVADEDLVTQRQTVLGIVKTAEYLGVRWRTDPARAVRYAALLTEMYGPDHDAYRPRFDVTAVANAPATITTADMQAPACSLRKFSER